jgi:hypothetical protein
VAQDLIAILGHWSPTWCSCPPQAELRIPRQHPCTQHPNVKQSGWRWRERLAGESVAGERMSDTSQGPGWWQASDGKWYKPESHPDYVPPLRPPAPEAPAPAPSPPAVPNAKAASAPKIAPTPMQWVMIGAGAVGIFGTLTTWVTASAGFISVSKNGISSGDGKIAVVLALVATAATLVTVWRPSRVLAIVQVIFFGLLAILSVYEIVHISSKSYSGDGITITASVGIGVYLCLLGGVAGVVAWIISWRQTSQSGDVS